LKGLRAAWNKYSVPYLKLSENKEKKKWTGEE
jgi:hypothetical protein